MFSYASIMWTVFLALTVVAAVINRKLYSDYIKHRRHTQLGKLRHKSLMRGLMRFFLPQIKSDMPDRFKTAILVQYMLIGFCVFSLVSRRM